VANIAQALDFTSSPTLTAPTFTVAQFVAAACPGEVLPANEAGEWADLKELAISLGWSLPA
jgi:hypothetical protein